MKSVAKNLAKLYSESFGGKLSGRYRIPRKLVAELAGRRRLFEDDIHALSRALYEEGFILIDMETFFVVLSTKTFANYRRANADTIEEARDENKPKGALN